MISSGTPDAGSALTWIPWLIGLFCTLLGLSSAFLWWLVQLVWKARGELSALSLKLASVSTDITSASLKAEMGQKAIISDFKELKGRVGTLEMRMNSTDKFRAVMESHSNEDKDR